MSTVSTLCTKGLFMFIGSQSIAAPAGVEQTAAVLNIPPATQRAWVQASANNIRFSLDGSATSPLHGLTLLVTQHPVWIEREDLARIRFISANVAAGAQFDIQYFTTRNI